MHCHRFERKLCTLLKRNSWEYDDRQRKVTRPWNCLLFSWWERGGRAFQTCEAALDRTKTWSFTIFTSFNERDFFFLNAMPAIWTLYPVTVQSQQVCSHWWFTILSSHAGLVLIFCCNKSPLPKGKSSVNVSCRCFNVVVNERGTFVTCSTTNWRL